MRVAALAFGVLAGLVASLILALGGLEVISAAGASPDRQAQAIRFGLFVIGNAGMLGAALALAAPLAGGIVLVVGALAWVAAALLLHHTTDFVLITPPALLLIAAALAFVAHFRRPREADEDEDGEVDVEIITPRREKRPPNPLEADDGMPIPSFAEAQTGRPAPVRGMSDEEQIRGGNGDDNWNPRKRRPPPPRAKTAFRQLDEDDEDEPSGLARFTLGISGFLSFGLYAALAGAAVLIFWNLRTGGDSPTIAAVESPALSSPVSVVAPASSEPVLAPVLSSSVEPQTAALASSTEPIRLVDPAGAVVASPEENFGEVVMPTDPTAPPRLSEDAGLPFDEASVSSVEPSADPMVLEPGAEEQSAELESPPQTAEATSTPTTGAMMPRSVPPQMAALRTAPGTGPTQVRSAPAQSNDAGL